MVLLAPPPCWGAAGRRSRRAAGWVALGGGQAGGALGVRGIVCGDPPRGAGGRPGGRPAGLPGGGPAGGESRRPGISGEGRLRGSALWWGVAGGGDCRACPPVGRVAIPPGHQPAGEGCRGSAGGGRRRRLGRRVRLEPGALRAARDGALWSALRDHQPPGGAAVEGCARRPPGGHRSPPGAGAFLCPACVAAPAAGARRWRASRAVLRAAVLATRAAAGAGPAPGRLPLRRRL